MAIHALIKLNTDPTWACSYLAISSRIPDSSAINDRDIPNEHSGRGRGDLSRTWEDGITNGYVREMSSGKLALTPSSSTPITGPDIWSRKDCIRHRWPYSQGNLAPPGGGRSLCSLFLGPILSRRVQVHRSYVRLISRRTRHGVGRCYIAAWIPDRYHLVISQLESRDVCPLPFKHSE